MALIKMYLPFAILLLFASQSLSLPQDIKFGGSTSADNSEKDPADVKSRLGLVASVLGNHPTGDDLATNSDFQEDKEFKESPKDRQNQNQQRHCCCVHVSNQCPNRNSQLIEGGTGGSFGGQPRTKDTTESLEGDIAVRIVNDPVEVSQPQTKLEDYCEPNERSCCYESSFALNNVINQSRCLVRKRPSTKKVFWDQKCRETEPFNIRQGEKRCGERRFREISGKQKGEANPGEFPWTCLVLNQDNDFIGSCAIVPDNRNNDVRGGTDRVVTAAHKLKKIKKLE